MLPVPAVFLIAGTKGLIEFEYVNPIIAYAFGPARCRREYSL